MDKINYQVWLKAEPFKNSVGKTKSDILFSTELGKKSLFKIFDILKSEVKIPSKEEETNSVEVIFKLFAEEDLSTDERIEKTINEYLKNLRNYEVLLNKINNILISLRRSKIKFWENIFDDYLINKEENDKKLQNLWLNRRTKLIDF